MILDRKKNPYLGIIFLIVSGILCIISEFIQWTNQFTAFELFRLSEITNHIIYLFPLIGGIGVLIAVINIAFFSKSGQKFWNILLIIILNLLFYFLLTIFSSQGAYLWKYLGIYLIIIGIICLFLGILFQFTKTENNSENK